MTWEPETRPIVIKLDAEAWEKFAEALNAPPQLCPRMHRLLTEPSVLDVPPPPAREEK